MTVLSLFPLLISVMYLFCLILSQSISVWLSKSLENTRYNGRRVDESLARTSTASWYGGWSPENSIIKFSREVLWRKRNKCYPSIFFVCWSSELSNRSNEGKNIEKNRKIDHPLIKIKIKGKISLNVQKINKSHSSSSNNWNSFLLYLFATHFFNRPKYWKYK